MDRQHRLILHGFSRFGLLTDLRVYTRYEVMIVNVVQTILHVYTNGTDSVIGPAREVAKFDVNVSYAQWA